MIRKHGGMWFWSVGRLGGSVYLKRKAPRPMTQAEIEQAYSDTYGGEWKQTPWPRRNRLVAALNFIIGSIGFAAMVLGVAVSMSLFD